MEKPFRMVAPAGAFLVAFMLYLLTYSRSIGWYDSAELALVAWQMGASHAPGSPAHSVIGHWATWLVSEPFVGTTLLSVFTAAATVLILGLLLVRLGVESLIAAGVSTVYALSVQVWTNATITEVYSLNMAVLGLTVLFAWLWCSTFRQRYLLLMLLCYGLSLTAYFANILLLPAFAYIVLSSSGRSRIALGAFATCVGVAVCIAAIGNLLLAQNAAPFGEIVPDSLRNVALYMTGAQHEPLRVRGWEFLSGRVIDHMLAFSRSIGFIAIPFGLLGIYFIDRLHRAFGVFLALIFVIYFGYYTVFGPGDYVMMVLPAYFVVAIWFAAGLQGIYVAVGRAPAMLAVKLLPLFAAIWLFSLQFEERRRLAVDAGAERFAAETFSLLPQNAVAITGWREFTTLRYFQIVHRQRPDLKILVPANTERHYEFGAVSDYRVYVDSVICDTAVFTSKSTDELADHYALAEGRVADVWAKLELAQGRAGELCGQEAG